MFNARKKDEKLYLHIYQYNMYVLINLFATNSCVKYICPFERILKLFALDVSSNLFVMIAAVKYLFVVICLSYLL